MNNHKIKEVLQGEGFAIEENKSFEKQDLTVDIYGYREGRNALVFAFKDFFFINDFDKGESSMDRFENLHEKARKYANSKYKMPKALRFSAPNIATIAISENGFSSEMIEKVQKNTRSFVGGEIHGMFLIDLKTKQMFSQGINLILVPGEAKLVLGHRKEFKKIDPQNRAFYIVKKLAENLFIS